MHTLPEGRLWAGPFQVLIIGDFALLGYQQIPEAEATEIVKRLREEGFFGSRPVIIVRGTLNFQALADCEPLQKLIDSRIEAALLTAMNGVNAAKDG